MDPEFQDLIQRAQEGDAVAIEHLLEAFEPEVRAMVRSLLPRRLRQRFDSMDFVQEVWRSLLERSFREGLNHEDAARFRGYLAGVVRNKVYEEYRRQTNQKNDASREEPIDAARDGRRDPIAIAARDATPSEEMHARDCLDRLVAGGSPVEARIVDLRREGLTFAEVAVRLGIPERSIRRMVTDMRARWPGQGAVR